MLRRTLNVQKSKILYESKQLIMTTHMDTIMSENNQKNQRIHLQRTYKNQRIHDVNVEKETPTCHIASI